MVMNTTASRAERHRACTFELESQAARYENHYSARRRVLRRLVRFDVRYRVHRLRELIHELDLEARPLSVLEVGYGNGELLASLPLPWRITGAELAWSAVRQARQDPRFRGFRGARFVQITECADTLPPGPFDLVLSSHVLEHVPNDAELLHAMRARLAVHGTLILFVPIEEPDYIRFHRRNYSLQSIVERVSQAGFEVTRAEGSMHVNGHVWKLLTIPSRRAWPLMGPAVDALRCTSLSLLPYRLIRATDAMMDALGFGARQALVVARRV